MEKQNIFKNEITLREVITMERLKKIFKRVLFVFFIATLSIGFFAFSQPDCYKNPESKPVRNYKAEGDCETLAFLHLEEVMDKTHSFFYVYSDQDAGENHGYPTGWMGDINGLQLDTGCMDTYYSGTSCIKVTWLTPIDELWVGVMWQEPENNWGENPGRGYDLTGATELSFWAKKESEEALVNFLVGGIKGSYPDSIQPQIETGMIQLTDDWQYYTINLENRDLTNVIGLFGWVTNTPSVFYIDEIKINKSREDEPRFLLSYETLPQIEPDRYLRNVCFVYDNALVLLAFLSRGNAEDLRRARIIADAFLLAQGNDRAFKDGRLRNGYMSGDLLHHQTGKARLPGWWDPEDEKWYEDRFNVSTHTGNMAWIIIALLEFYKHVEEYNYVESAIRLGNWIESETRDSRGAGGYTGGYEGWEQTETNPEGQNKVLWKSTEHNLDCYVAFMRLYLVTGDPKWEDLAFHARTFVEAMWNEEEGHFWTGTTGEVDETTGEEVINRKNIPADVNTWGLMVLEDIQQYGKGITWVEENCYVEADGFKGFDFNNDRDHVWFEGTSHQIICYDMLDETAKREEFLNEVRRAQSTGLNNNGKGIIAASNDGLTTGFDWLYFARLHIGATAWFIFAERGYNPYWGTRTSVEPTPEPAMTTPDPFTNQYIIFQDSFNDGCSGWTTKGNVTCISGNPNFMRNYVKINATGSIKRTISTKGYKNIIVSFYISAKFNGIDSEYMKAIWNNGTEWQLLKRINNGDPEEDGLFHRFNYLLPVDAANNPRFQIKFKLVADENRDYTQIDDIIIKGIEYTPAPTKTPTPAETPSPTPDPTLTPTPSPIYSMQQITTNLNVYPIAKYCSNATEVLLNSEPVTLDSYNGFSANVELQTGLNSFTVISTLDDRVLEVNDIEITHDPSFSTEERTILYSYWAGDTVIIDLDQDAIIGILLDTSIVASTHKGDFVVDTKGNVYETGSHTIAGQRLPFSVNSVFPVFSSDDFFIYAGTEKIDFQTRTLVSNQFPVNVHNHTTRILNDAITLVKGHRGNFIYVNLETDTIVKEVDIGMVRILGNLSTTDITGRYGIVTGYDYASGSYKLGDLTYSIVLEQYHGGDYLGHAVFSNDSSLAFIPSYGNSYYGGGGIYVIDIKTLELLQYYQQFGAFSVCIDPQNTIYISSRFVVHGSPKGMRERRGIDVLHFDNNILTYSHTYYMNYEHSYSISPAFFIRSSGQ